jgi:alpha-tubulin suppressor-like RCC1 family protein
VAAGFTHSLALLSDGTVWAWGCNFNGQLGDGTTTQRTSPVQVTGLSGVVRAVAAGWFHNLAVMSDGHVWSWGLNDHGQVGDGTTTNRTSPVQIPDSLLSGVTAVAAGGYHSLALKTDGTVSAWGYNLYGQVGDNTTIDRSGPVQVLGPTGASGIAAGAYHSLGLVTQGTQVTAWAWGQNNYGQLGIASTTPSMPVPIPVWGGVGSALSGVLAIAGGGSHTLAITSS